MAASVAVVTVAVAGCGAAGTPAAKGGVNPSAGASNSPTPVKPIAIDEAKWFREIRLEDWTENGGDTAVMQAVLHRIQKATGERENRQWFDTVISPGPGNWITEWTTIAQQALGEADAAHSRGDPRTARNQYRAASLYFTVAAYPQHRETAEEENAYRMAKDAYEQAARLGDAAFERLQVPLEGGTFEAFLHLPKGNGPFPVVVVSGGIDVAKTEHLTLFEKYLAPAGIAMASLDNAGFGDSQDWPADNPEMDRLYSAVVNTLGAHQLIDAKRIGAIGMSYGGNTVGRLAFTDERVKAVVSVCGPVHQTLNAGTAFIGNLPPQARAALAARYNVPVENTKRLAQLARKASLVNQGYVGKVRTDTPILVLVTADDPFAPVSDVKRLAASSARGEVKITGGHGHCPPVKERNPAASDWVNRNL
ncbi:alpha/beta fold hydrolase [Nonomuraea sp. NPDC049714]|uniref:alpha/beta fold hydrolase n=1 Tax=Nonomuraea sp. NPDC049714 TaxID=3364357 RepID=UPI0037B27F3D